MGTTAFTFMNIGSSGLQWKGADRSCKYTTSGSAGIRSKVSPLDRPLLWNPPSFENVGLVLAGVPSFRPGTIALERSTSAYISYRIKQFVWNEQGNARKDQ